MNSHASLDRLSSSRWSVALTLTSAMLVAYFGFILLVAFNPALMAARVATGLSLGMLLGALVIVAAWILTLVYIRWANGRYDARVAALKREGV